MVRNFPKAVLVDNPSAVYNETDNRIALLHMARDLAGPGNVLISLDADERLTPVILKESLRTQLLGLPAGSGIKIPFANITNSGDSYWRVDIDPIGWVDDGRESDVTAPIHFPRTCISNFSQVYDFEDLLIIHLQYLDEGRFAGKQIWYILKEIKEFGKRNLVFIFRRYMHVLGVDARSLRVTPEEWVAEYAKHGVDIFHSKAPGTDWRESEVDRLKRAFSQKDLNKLPRKYFSEMQRLGVLEGIVHSYLEKSQKLILRWPRSAVAIAIRLLDYPLSIFWRAESRSNRGPNIRS
jgi:hypothetical protein